MADAPGKGFEKMIVPHFNIGRDEVGDGRRGAAEENIFAGSLQVIVQNFEWPRSVRTADGVGVVTDAVNIGYIGIYDGCVGAIEQYAAFHNCCIRMSVYVAAIHDQIMRRLIRRILRSGGVRFDARFLLRQ